jgi:hypothetical protein
VAAVAVLHQMDSQAEVAEEGTAPLSLLRVSVTSEGLVFLARVRGLTAVVAVLVVLVETALALLAAREVRVFLQR